MAANGREIAPSAILQSFCTQTITTENGSRAAKSKNPSVRTHARDNTHARDKIRKNLYLRRVSQFFDGQNLTKGFLIL